MRKYLTVSRLCFSMAMDYRFENILWMLIDIIPILIAIVTWKSIYSDKEIISGISFAQLVLYYLGTILIEKITATHFEERWMGRVQKGEIDTYFIKPISFPIFLLFELFANRFLGLILFVIPLSILAVGFLGNIFEAFSPNIVSLLFLPAFLACAMIINFILSFIILMCGIWFEEAESLSHAKWLGISIFGGILAPLQFFPHWMQTVSEFLPFKRMVFLPAMMFSQTYSWQYLLKELSILMLYMMLFLGLAYGVWKKAVRAYTSFGG